MGNLKFGWAEENITPSEHIPLAGQFAERISQYIEKPIVATALAISNGEEQIIFVSCDLVGTPVNLLDAVREKLEVNSLGIDPMKIVISAIHTHTGPEFPRTQRTKMPFFSSTAKRIIKELLPPDKKYIEKEKVLGNTDIISQDEILKFLTDKIYNVILSAWQNRKTGAFACGFGRAAVGMCRRAVYSDGSAKMWGDTDTATFVELEGGNDSGIELMYIFDETKNLTGVVANIACPAQCVQHRLFVSPDFWGEVKMILRQRFGENIFLLAQCSAAGDQCPVDLIRWVNPESPVNDPNIERVNPKERNADPSMFDISGMKKTGRRIANEIISVFEDGFDEIKKDAEFKHKVSVMKLPLRRVTPTDTENAKAAIRDYLEHKKGDVDYVDAAKLQRYVGIINRMDVQEYQNILDTEVHIVRFGDVAFATNPFELFLDYGNKIKARSRARQTFLIQLANGSEGYLPTEKAEKGGHYSAFVSSGLVGSAGGEMLVRETLDEINSMF